MKFFGKIFSSEESSRSRSSTVVDLSSRRGSLKPKDNVVDQDPNAETIEQLRREVRRLKQENEELRHKWKQECVRGNDLAKKLCEASKEKHALRVRITTIRQKSEENLPETKEKDFYAEETESAGNSRTNSTTKLEVLSGKQSPYIPSNNL